MTIDELIQELQSTKKIIIEQGRKPDDYPLSLQIDIGEQSVCSDTLTVEWDGGACVSGTVLLGEVNDE